MQTAEETMWRARVTPSRLQLELGKRHSEFYQVIFICIASIQNKERVKTDFTEVAGQL